MVRHQHVVALHHDDLDTMSAIGGFGMSKAEALVVRANDPQTALDLLLVGLEAVRESLVTARSIKDVNEGRAQAEAIRVYVQRVQLGREAEIAAAEVVMRAERRVGALLRETPLDKGGRPGKTKPHGGAVSLRSLGIDDHESADFQRLADIPEEEFERRLEAARAAGRITRSAILQDLAGEEPIVLDRQPFHGNYAESDDEYSARLARAVRDWPQGYVHLREVVLVYPPEIHAHFADLVRQLMRRWQTPDVRSTVLRALEEATAKG